LQVFKLIYVLFRVKLFSPLGLYSLIAAIHKYGINLMPLLSFAERVYSDKVAVVDDHETLNYQQLLLQSKKLSAIFNERYQLSSGNKVGIMCKNHASLIKAIFALSLLGVDVYLLNAEISKHQFNNLIKRYDFNLLIYDFQLDSLVKQSDYANGVVLSYHTDLPAISNLLNSVSEQQEIKRSSPGKLVILTGGTTGDPKAAPYKPSLLNFLNPFLALITRLKLLNYRTAYIATPIYHGYGVGILFVLIALGRKIVISNGFDAQRACSLIREHNVEVVTVVPLMIDKMLNNNVEDLNSLACIASGGAQLNPRLVGETMNKLGSVLYNLYGTSEAGLNVIATPQDLSYSAETIGKKIDGVRLKVLDQHKNEVEAGEVGQFCIKNRWSMSNQNNCWLETGDLGYKDSRGHYYLCGRVDDMVVSAGENVYPIELEQILLNHPEVEEAAVIGVSDEKFGQRLKAFVLPAANATVTKEELFQWLGPRVARFQMPKDIAFVDDMPYTPVGKLDKKQLKFSEKSF